MSDDLLLLGAGALLLFALRKNTADTPMAYEHAANEALIAAPPPSPLAPAPSPSTPAVSVVSRSTGGALSATPIGSVKTGLDFINTSIAQGQTIMSPGYTIIGQNTTFVDPKSGNTYKTGANQTVQKLPGVSSPKVISIRTVK